VLIRRGAKVDVKDNEEMTPILRASLAARRLYRRGFPEAFYSRYEKVLIMLFQTMDSTRGPMEASDASSESGDDLPGSEAPADSDDEYFLERDLKDLESKRAWKLLPHRLQARLVRHFAGAGT